ncbi:MOSC domain-containing protein [Sulfurimonas sp.]|uniref:MOSC domain-containing protein n=1 Tax=Sulfurimonas sp. TaxID=2022749 RepID=UPI003D0F0020
MKKISQVLYVKVGKIANTPLENSNKKEMISGIKKLPVKKAFLTTTGFKEDAQADLKHHGGENKALFLFSQDTYEKINQECKTDFKVDEVAHFGENLILSNISEKDVFLGDIYQIGEVLVQVTQPRQPCWKLSANTGVKEMTKFILESGYTGWYAKVLQEGTISQNDDLFLKERVENELSIEILNKLMFDISYDKRLAKKAVDSTLLGKPFQESLEKKYIKEFS